MHAFICTRTYINGYVCVCIYACMWVHFVLLTRTFCAGCRLIASRLNTRVLSKTIPGQRLGAHVDDQKLSPGHAEKELWAHCCDCVARRPLWDCQPSRLCGLQVRLPRNDGSVERGNRRHEKRGRHQRPHLLPLPRLVIRDAAVVCQIPPQCMLEIMSSVLGSDRSFVCIARGRLALRDFVL